MNQAVLEVNPNHPIVKDMARRVALDKESKELENSALLMYDVAAMTSGYDVDDLKSFANRVMGLMGANLEGGIDEISATVESGASSVDHMSEDDEVETKAVEVIE